jgi:hypothetical protein
MQLTDGRPPKRPYLRDRRSSITPAAVRKTPSGARGDTGKPDPLPEPPPVCGRDDVDGDEVDCDAVDSMVAGFLAVPPPPVLGTTPGIEGGCGVDVASAPATCGGPVVGVGVGILVFVGLGVGFAVG